MKRSALPFVRGVYGAGAQMPEAKASQWRERPRHVAAAVVAHHAADGDPPRRQTRRRSAAETRRTWPSWSARTST